MPNLEPSSSPSSGSGGGSTYENSTSFAASEPAAFCFRGGAALPSTRPESGGPRAMRSIKPFDLISLSIIPERASSFVAHSGRYSASGKCSTSKYLSNRSTSFSSSWISSGVRKSSSDEPDASENQTTSAGSHRKTPLARIFRPRHSSGAAAPLEAPEAGGGGVPAALAEQYRKPRQSACGMTCLSCLGRGPAADKARTAQLKGLRGTATGTGSLARKLRTRALFSNIAC
mmetsp:Transcript_7675/g.14311  ORF Transcript_7675/g.14311 Transcript_7675/m.14311 type:complete len:230 (-) Transcript_7675:29-718(-)